MNGIPPILLHDTGGIEAVDQIRPLWEKLRLHHLPLAPEFAGELRKFDFESRKQELLAKAANGKLRIEFVQREAGTSLIAYCLCTVTAKGRGEVDSMFVEQEFRDFLGCGFLAGGFARFQCATCRLDHLVAFSCKGRGLG